MIAGLTWRCVTLTGSKVHLVSDPIFTSTWRLGTTRTLCGQRMVMLLRAKSGDERAVSCEHCRRVAEGVVAFETRTVAALLEGRR